MSKKARVKSIAKGSNENRKLIAKLLKQRKQYKNVKQFKKDNPEKTSEILYEVRVENPKLKGQELQQKVNQAINKHLQKITNAERKKARRKKNEEIVKRQDEVRQAKADLKEAKKNKTTKAIVKGK